jgi:AAA domain/PLD-like domain
MRVSSPTFASGVSVLLKAPATERDPKQLVRYWRQCLRESMLRDPKIQEGVTVECEQVEAGHLPPSVVDEIHAQPKKTDSSEKPRNGRFASPGGHHLAALEEPQRDPVRVLVAPYMLTAVKLPSRSQEEDPIPPFWVPAQLMPDGKLHPDPDHLPFVPRVLLDPSIGDRAERWPTPIASLNEYDRTIRKMDVDRQEGWQARLQHAKEMFEEVAGIAINEWSHKGWQREKPVVVPWERHPDSAKQILPLCEAWLQAETLPGALTAILTPADKPSRIGPAIEADQRHLGHCGDSLNSEQRDAVRAVRLLNEGEVQAVNGPPGTGKTSLLKTLIADAVVNAAVAGAPPPRIVVTSTNNKPVQKAARDLTFPNGAGLPVERERWLPRLTHFAAFAPSLEQAKKAKGLLLLKELDALIFSKDFAEAAEPYFLERFKAWQSCLEPLNGIPPRINLTFAKAALKEQLGKVVAIIKAKAGVVAKAERLVAEGEAMSLRPDQVPAKIAGVRSRLNQAEADVGASKQGAADLNDEHKEAINALVHRAKLHPLWMHWLSFFPPIEAQRAALLRRTATELRYLPAVDGETLDSLAQVYETVDVAFVRRKEEAAGRAKVLEAEQAQLQISLDLWTELEGWIAGYVDPGASNAFDAGRRRIDVQLRAKAFDLAMRMREAEFLLRRKEWDERWITTEGSGRSTRYDRLKLLKTYAFVVPCIMATVYIAAEHCCFFDPATRLDQPMELPVDLLIYDEAGQVSPDLGLPLLGLARRAVAVGDVYQLEPIESFNEASDDLILRTEKIEEEQLHAFRRGGLTHVGGSVMRAFQPATAYTNRETPCGVLLCRHFRCVPKIIAYCNDLVYKGELIPDKPDEEAPWIAPVSWAHVRGDARKAGGSWGNEPEAESIARWIADNRETIRKRYDGDLDKTVALLTPYAHQQGLLRKTLRSRIGGLADKVTIGTVHSLQGDERPLVVFSPTVTLASTGATTPFFDRGPNMLNVAVSRAKNAFVVIGDMGLFDEACERAPSGVLARHLFAEPGNELLDVLPAVAVTIPDLVERIEGTERHRELLVEAFDKATRRLLISSPFLTRSAIEDDEVTSLIRAARKRNVAVDIYTGLKGSNDHNAAFLDAAIVLLVNAGARVWRTNRVHAKTLACDEMLVIEGSFNWLSAPRDPTRARKETSFAVWGRPAQAHAAAVEAEFAALDAVLQTARR